jgi:hypothetical protein
VRHVALAFLLVGCAGTARAPTYDISRAYWHDAGYTITIPPSDHVITWRFECDFPEVYRQQVRDAFRFWDNMVERDLFRERACADPASADWTMVASPHYFAPEPKTVDIRTWAVTDDDDKKKTWKGGRIIFFRPYFLNKNHEWFFRESVARHEVGHVLGFLHLSEESCIMYPFVNGPNQKFEGAVKSGCTYERDVFRRFYQVYVRD